MKFFDALLLLIILAWVVCWMTGEYEKMLYSYETTIRVKGHPVRVIPRFCNLKLSQNSAHIDCGTVADFAYPAADVELTHRKKTEGRP